MKNTLADLNNYLFKAIERIDDDNLSDDQLDKEIRRADAVTKIAGTIISNANTQLRAVEHMDKYGYQGERAMPELLIGLPKDGGKKP